MMTHRIRRSTTTNGYEAACSCGWRTIRRTRELRDLDADAHAITALEQPATLT
jgi:hypothetical protein